MVANKGHFLFKKGDLLAEEHSEFTSNRIPADKVRTEIFVFKSLSLHFALFYEVLLIQCVTNELILQAGSVL